VDYHALNEGAIKVMFPILVVDELLGELRGTTFLTKLDLHPGYHLVRMHHEDVAKTVFQTHEPL